MEESIISLCPVYLPYYYDIITLLNLNLCVHINSCVALPMIISACTATVTVLGLCVCLLKALQLDGHTSWFKSYIIMVFQLTEFQNVFAHLWLFWYVNNSSTYTYLVYM